MKKLLLFSALLIAGFGANAQSATRSQPASSQQTTDATAKATSQTDEMSKILDLTADQKPKVYAINLAKNKEIETAPADKEKINEARKNELKAVLTAEQMVKLQKALDERAARVDKAKK